MNDPAVVGERICVEQRARSGLLVADQGTSVVSVVRRGLDYSFGVAFRTPAENGKGVAHVLEHCAFIGPTTNLWLDDSTRITTDPTITHAYGRVYPDRTCYFVASPSLDALEDVMDTVLKGLRLPRVLRSRPSAAFNAPDDGVVPVAGTVISEMRGRCGTPDGQVRRLIRRLAFDSSEYRWDTGGDPDLIGSCTWTDVHSYHARYYRPENMLAYVCGPTDFSGLLLARLHDEWSGTPSPTDGGAPREGERDRAGIPQYLRTFEDAGTAYGLLAWVLPAMTRGDDRLLGEVVGQLLRAAAAGYCESRYSTGLRLTPFATGVDYLRTPLVTLGLRGDCSSDEVDGGILEAAEWVAGYAGRRDHVEAAFDRIDRQLRTVSPNEPYALRLFVRMAQAWAYDQPCWRIVNDLGDLRALRRVILGNLPWFATTMARLLDPRAIRVGVHTVLGVWDRYQPRLGNASPVRASEADIPLDAGPLVEPDVATSHRTAPPGPCIAGPNDRPDRPARRAILVTPIPTNGTPYVRVGFDISAVPSSLLGYVPLIAAAWCDDGCAALGGTAFARQRRSRPDTFESRYLIDGPGPAAPISGWILLGTVAPPGQVEAVLANVAELIRRFDITDAGRVASTTRSLLDGRVADLPRRGHILADTRLRSYCGDAGWYLRDQVEGLGQVLFLRRTLDRLEADAASVLSEIRYVSTLMHHSGRTILNAMCDRASAGMAERLLHGVEAALPRISGSPPPASRLAPVAASRLELFRVGIGAAIFGVSLYLPEFTLDRSIIGPVLARYLTHGLLCPSEAARSSTYEAFAGFDGATGVLTLVGLLTSNLGELERTFSKISRTLRACDVTSESFQWCRQGFQASQDESRLSAAELGYRALSRALLPDRALAESRPGPLSGDIGQDEIDAFAHGVDASWSTSNSLVIARDTNHIDLARPHAARIAHALV